MQVEIIRKRVKHMYLRVYPTGEVRVTAPLRATDETIRAFIDKNEPRVRAWLSERCDAFSYRAGDRVYDFGSPLTLAFLDGEGKARAERVGEALVVRLRGGVDAPYEARRDAVLDYYKRRVEARAGERIRAISDAVGKSPSSLHVRLMRTRWGSCTVGTGAIRLNTTLAWYPPAVLDAVLAHELTHLWVNGHGAAFYQRLSRAYPAWREVREMRRRFPPCPLR